jgi:dTDP-4-amino-4,6-dideoxygalactose transaminase
MIPFSPPYISPLVEQEVLDTLRSGWITTGPKTKKLENEISIYSKVPNVLCLNSATAGLELALRWMGITAGDEVIVPAYTYSATANVVIHCGAKPIMVDVNSDDFNVNILAVKNAITSKTKAIIPVDFAGWPCDYVQLNDLISSPEILSMFVPNTNNQKLLGRILLLSDAAHSLGASYNYQKTGKAADITVFSFHAVKNLTTAEGGAMCLNMPPPFDNLIIYKELYIKSLHGQTKDALAKTEKGAWEYDIIEAGYKCNMPDIAAAIGLAQFKEYESLILPRRKVIFNKYFNYFSNYQWAILPQNSSNIKVSSFHLFPLRILNISIEQRNKILQHIFEQDVMVNVHFKPLPILTFYKNLGYNIDHYPIAYNNYATEISLPIYFGLSDVNIETVCEVVKTAIEIEL